MKKISKKLSRIVIVLVALIIWCIYSYEQSDKTTLVNAGVVSNTKIGWGIKRVDNHKQPELRKNKFSINAKI